MKVQKFPALIAVTAVLLGACGGAPDPDPDAGSDEALAIAVAVCNQALAGQGGRTDLEVVEDDKKLADEAARAGVASDDFKGLARAMSDWALTRQDLAEATEKLLSGEDIGPELDAIPARVDDARRSLVAECRAVKAMGGDVDSTLLDSA